MLKRVMSPERHKELLEEEEAWKKEQNRKKRFKVIAKIRTWEYKEQRKKFTERAKGEQNN